MKTLQLFVFLFCAQLTFAQTTLKGLFILNDQSKAPVSNITVNTADHTFQEVSDNNGFISLVGMKDQKLSLFFNGVGFEHDEVLLSELKIEHDYAYVYLIPKQTRIEEVKITNRSARNNVFQTLSDLDIKIRPINNSQEVLRSVPGLFIGQHAGGGKAEQLFIRGFDVDHGTDVQITADGMPVNMVSHAHGQGYADLHFIIPEFIEKVNFNKGPYFADKGNFNTAGFVDFRTADVLDRNFIKAEIGQFKSYRGVLGANLINKKNNKDHSLYFGAEANFTDGYFDNPQDFSRYNAMLKYHGKLNDHNYLTATVSGLTSKWYASGQIPLLEVNAGRLNWFGAIDPTEGGSTSRYNANLELTTYLENGGKLRNQAYYVNYNFELYSNFTFYKFDEENGDEIRQKENRNIFGYNGSYEKKFDLGNVKTETNAGVQLRYDNIPHSELTRTVHRETSEKLKFGTTNEMNLGLYWTQKFSITDDFDITPGVRYDFFTNKYLNRLDFNDEYFDAGKTYSSTSGIFSPKLNFNYKVNDNVQLYSYWGKGFHSNDTRVAVARDGKKVLTGAWGTDLGGVFKIGKNLILQAAGYYLWLDQEFMYVGDEAVVEPGGKTQRMGIDVSARYEIIKYLYADINFNYTYARAKTTFDDNGVEVPTVKGFDYLGLAPKILSTGGFTYRKQEGWNGSLRYRWMGDRPADEAMERVVKGYFVVDGSVNYATKKWEAGVSVQNIFNVKWGETQFDTEYRLKDDPTGVTTTNICVTPGTPFFAKAQFTYFF